MKLKKHLKDDHWKQDAPELNFESHSKGSSVNMVFLFFVFNKFAYISKNLFLLCHYGLLCVDLRKLFCLIHFRIRL